MAANDANTFRFTFGPNVHVSFSHARYYRHGAPDGIVVLRDDRGVPLRVISENALMAGKLGPQVRVEDESAIPTRLEGSMQETLFILNGLRKKTGLEFKPDGDGYRANVEGILTNGMNRSYKNAPDLVEQVLRGRPLQGVFDFRKDDYDTVTDIRLNHAMTREQLEAFNERSHVILLLKNGKYKEAGTLFAGLSETAPAPKDPIATGFHYHQDQQPKPLADVGVLNPYPTRSAHAFAKFDEHPLADLGRLNVPPMSSIAMPSPSSKPLPASGCAPKELSPKDKLAIAQIMSMVLHEKGILKHSPNDFGKGIDGLDGHFGKGGGGATGASFREFFSDTGFPPYADLPDEKFRRLVERFQSVMEGTDGKPLEISHVLDDETRKVILREQHRYQSRVKVDGRIVPVTYPLDNVLKDCQEVQAAPVKPVPAAAVEPDPDPAPRPVAPAAPSAPASPQPPAASKPAEPPKAATPAVPSASGPSDKVEVNPLITASDATATASAGNASKPAADGKGVKLGKLNVDCVPSVLLGSVESVPDLFSGRPGYSPRLPKPCNTFNLPE